MTVTTQLQSTNTPVPAQSSHGGLTLTEPNQRVFPIGNERDKIFRRPVTVLLSKELPTGDLPDSKNPY